MSLSGVSLISVTSVMFDLEAKVMEVDASPLLTKGAASPSSLGQSDVALKKNKGVKS